MTQTSDRRMADLVEGQVVVGVEAVGGRRGLRLGGMDVGGDGHGREGHVEGGRPRRVAVQLEGSAERRELGPEAAHMAGLARLAGLHGEGGNGPGRTRPGRGGHGGRGHQGGARARRI